MTHFFKTMFVFSAFAPLYLIIALKLLMDDEHCWGGIFLGTTAIAAAIGCYLATNLEIGEAKKHKLTEVRSIDSEIFPYLLTYIPIIIENDITKGTAAIPLAALYLLVLLLYIRLDSPYLHPVFALLGYRIYSAKTGANELPIVIVSRGRKLAGKDEVMLHEVGTSDIYYCDKL